MSEDAGSTHVKRPVKIVVSDKQRRETKQFSCDWHSLRRSMKYFETVLDKVPESSTAPLTLNVNCDLVIFAWLMDYVNNFNPQLKVSNVVSIILSSHFLKMEELFKHALLFFKKHLAEVLTTDVNMSCVPPDVVVELENMLTIGDLALACLELQASDQDKCPNRMFLSQLVKTITLTIVLPQRAPAMRFCQFCGILFDAVKQQHFAARAAALASAAAGAPVPVVLCPALSQGRIGARGELMKSHDGTAVFAEQPPASAADCELWCWRFLGTTGIASCRRCTATIPLLSMRSHCCRGGPATLRDFLPAPENDVNSSSGKDKNSNASGRSTSSAFSNDAAEERILTRFFFEYTTVLPLEPVRGEITCDSDLGEQGGARVVWEGPIVASVFVGNGVSVNQDMLRFHETRMFEALQTLVDGLGPACVGPAGSNGKGGRNSRAQTAAVASAGNLGRNGSFRSSTSSAAALSASSSFGSVRSLASLKKKPLFK
jgi:hypothetical protein